MSEDMPFDLAFIERFALPRKSFPAGEKVFLEEDAGQEMYVVMSGRVNIITYGTVLESVKPFGIFGEMALIDDAPRSAAAIALDETEVVVIDRTNFLRMVGEFPPFSLHVMARLADRIRKMNQSL